MIGERSILLLSAVMLSVSAVALGVAAPYHVHAAQAGVRVAAGQDDEAMRKQLRKLGVPESEIDKTLKQLNEKLEEKGVSEGQRKYVMTLKERPVKIHMKWTAEVRPAVKSVAFRCGKKQGELTFSCRYMISGTDVIAAVLKYVSVKDTESVVREMGEGSVGITQKTLQIFSGKNTVATVTGECTAVVQERPLCDVRTISNFKTQNAGGNISGAVKSTPKGARIFFSVGLLQTKISGQAFSEKGAALSELKKDPLKLLGSSEVVDPAVLTHEVGISLDPKMVQEDYAAFFKQLFETGHFRHDYRGVTKVRVNDEEVNAKVDFTMDVELEGGPAPR